MLFPQTARRDAFAERLLFHVDILSFRNTEYTTYIITQERKKRNDLFLNFLSHSFEIYVRFVISLTRRARWATIATIKEE